MKSVAMSVVLVVASLGLAPQNPPKLPAGVRQVADLPYVENGDPAQRLDLYLPEKADGKPRPLIVWVHGGGWSGGKKDGCPALRWVKDGYVAASVEYRFSQNAVFPAQIQDCQAAIRWLRGHAKEYGIDPDHIGVWGESAGGHLVALLGTAGGKNAFEKVGADRAQSDAVQAVVDYYGPSDFNTVVEQAARDANVRNTFHFNEGDPYSKLIGVPLNSDVAKGNAVSPVHFASADAPPFLILHGTMDPLVPFAQSEELVAALVKAKAPTPFLQPLPGAGHSGGKFFQQPTYELVRKFLDKTLMGKDVKIELLTPAELHLDAPPTSRP